MSEEAVRFMEQPTALDYKIRVSPVLQRFGRRMKEGVITGHKCSSCGKVFVPPKGFCPLCVVVTGEEQEVEVRDRGLVTSFTVLTPIQYHGQQERENYALASILLDGADSTVGQQRVSGVALDQIKMGMRVQAVWAEEGERDASDGGRGWGFGNAIATWEPTGEPDVPRSEFEEHML